MKPSDPGQPHGAPRPGAAQPTAAETPAGGPRDPLRGLADPAESPALAPQRLSLWARIKRAFQYGSQGGDAG